MANFGDAPSKSAEEPSDTMKQPIKKLEPAINRFTKIAIPVDLERLSTHCRNIQKFHQQQQWGKLNSEQVNARRTVQQLKANVREMEKARLQVCDDDLEEFDRQVSPIKEEVIQAVVKVIELCGVESSPLDPPVMVQSLPESDENFRLRFRHTNSFEASSHVSPGESSNVIADHISKETPETEPTEVSQQHQTQEVIPTNEAQESWDHLKEELVALNSLTHEFASQVQAQQEMVDSIQNNIEVSQNNVSRGVRSLLKASTYKAAMLPVGGALIGGIVGGPVGLLAGAKLGAAAALGGGAIGFISGRALKKRNEKKLQMEMTALSSSTCDQSVMETGKNK